MNKFLFYSGMALFLATWIAAAIVIFSAENPITRSTKIGVDALLICGSVGILAMLIGARKRAKL